MTSPLIFLPVVPVLHDIINRNLTVAELLQGLLHLSLRLIAFPALPETQHPFRIYRRLTCQGAVARDNIIEVITSNKVVVHVAGHLAPDAQLSAFLLRARGRHTESAIALSAIRLPFNAKLRLLSFLQHRTELISVGVPSSTPAFCHHLLTIDIHLDIPCIVEDELIELLLAFTLTTTLRLDKALIHHIGTLQTESIRKVLDTTIVGLISNLRCSRITIFIIDRILIAHQFLSHPVDIGSRKMTFLAILVIELEGTVQLKIIIGITEAAEGIGIPQDTIVLVGEDKWNAYLGIILEEVFVLTLHVQFFRLMLTESVESLIGRTVELHLPLQTVFHLFCDGRTALKTVFPLGYSEMFEGLTILRLLQ